MHLLILAAIALAPVIAFFASLAFALVRIDCYGGVRVLGMRVRRGTKKWGPAPPVASTNRRGLALDWPALH